MNVERFFNLVGSDKALLAVFNFFGIICLVCGFFNPVHWLLSAGCFTVTLFIGKPKNGQSINNKKTN